MLAGRTFIDGPALPQFGFKVHKLLKSATAHRPLNNSHLIVLHFGVKKFDQLGSANRVDQDRAISDGSPFGRHAVAKASYLKTNHTGRTKCIKQRFGIGCIIAQISDNDRRSIAASALARALP